MRVRPSSRVVLLDPMGRVLLLRVEAPRVFGPGAVWILPGGGLEPGESWEDGARREVREETGIEPPSLGPCIWTRRVELPTERGVVLSDERYFLARVEAADAVADFQPDASEAGVFREFRWWDGAALARTDDRVLPPGLAELLAALIAGDIPPEPVEIA